VLIPGMSGPELGRAIRERSPETKLLFISGFTDGQLSGELGRGVSFLQKPFRSEEISAVVRDLLAR
jgi:two-component system cell cycle sensor histidine kinase/response regulator CckA